MNLLSRMRRSQFPVTRVLVALFATSWLGVAIQPCAAMSHDSMDAHPGTAGHHTVGDVPAHHCPHCPPAPDGNEACDEAGSLSCDGLETPVLPCKDLKTAQPDLPVLTGFLKIQDFSSGALAVPVLQADPGPWRPPTASPQQRFCSFLK